MFEDLKERLNLKENYVSMALGLLVILVVGAVIFNAVTGKREGAVTEKGVVTEEEEATKAGIRTDLPTTYTVAEGEDLWTVSENFYGSGYNWVDIVEANRIVNPDRVEAGTKLTIPAVTPRPTPTGQQTEVYTVRRGETLFDIAVKVYGDGFAWARIAQVNNLRNPNRIEVGQKLVIPR